MKIGIIGAGYIGGTAARLFVAAGHEVAIANSRGPESLDGLIRKIGEGARAATVAEAAAFGEVVLIAIPLGRFMELPPEVFDRKIVIDANNYYADRDGRIDELENRTISSSELLARHLKGARIVKAFNTIWYEHLRTQGDRTLPFEQRRAIFVAADDEEAKDTVSRLIYDIGFAPIDTGRLRSGGIAQEPETALYNRNLTASEALAVMGAQSY